MKIITALIVIAALVLPRAADACSPYRGGHYYAILQKANATNATSGAAIYIFTNSLTAANGSSFVDHEMWYGVDGAGAHWVEVGVTDGVTEYGSVVHHAVFWADNRAGSGGYHEHYPSVRWSSNVYYQVQVAWAGVPCAWNVFFGGTYIGRSTANCAGPTRMLEAGIESTNAAATQHVGGYMTGWEERARNNIWYRGWENPGLYATCPAAIKSYGPYTNEVLHGPL